MKINTGATVNTLKGEPYVNSDNEPITVGHVIAEALSADKTGGKMKLYALAQKCFTQKEVEVDGADLALIKKAIEASESYHNLITGQVLLALEEVK